METPKQSEAMSRLSEKIQEFGLGRVANELNGLTRKSIRLIPTPSTTLPTGSSKLGGLPDLADEIAWPTWKKVPLGFIAQINLVEAKPFDLEGVLPRSGMLYFFYEAASQTWGFDPKDSGSCRVLLHEGPASALKVREAPAGLPAQTDFLQQAVVLEPEITLPDWESPYIQQLGLTNHERDSYFGLLAAIRPRGPLHWLLGHPDQIHGDMLLECQLVSNGIYCGDLTCFHDPRRAVLENTATDWQLLLQVDSDDHGMMWGDAGHIYFWIRKQDLAERDFSNCWLILQCG
jgi:uncharacterized protein YwqG